MCQNVGLLLHHGGVKSKINLQWFSCSYASLLRWSFICFNAESFLCYKNIKILVHVKSVRSMNYENCIEIKTCNDWSPLTKKQIYAFNDLFNQMLCMIFWPTFTYIQSLWRVAKILDNIRSLLIWSYCTFSILIMSYFNMIFLNHLYCNFALFESMTQMWQTN